MHMHVYYVIQKSQMLETCVQENANCMGFLTKYAKGKFLLHRQSLVILRSSTISL